MWCYYFRFSGGVLLNERGRATPAKSYEDVGDYEWHETDGYLELNVIALNYGQACEHMGLIVNRFRRDIFGQAPAILAVLDV